MKRAASRDAASISRSVSFVDYAFLTFAAWRPVPSRRRTQTLSPVLKPSPEIAE
jgi:hypothetical protein